MRTEFASAIRQASDQVTTDGQIDHIKRAVTSEMKMADPAVTVHFTEYFNHVFVPDMVLRWPGESKERLLFLRPSANPAWLNDDVATLASHHALIFTLEDIEQRQVKDEFVTSAQLNDRATEADTWIAGPSAIQQVAEARKDSAVIGLLGQALVRGGRGLSTADSVSTLTSTTENAFKQAEAQEPKPIADSVASLESNLDSQQAGRFTRILRAVWEGNGGSSASFPTTASTGPLTDDDLSYLMTTLDDAPADFWRRVGKNVTTAQLGRMRLEDPSRSLQNFVSANLESLNAKGLRVLSEQARLGEGQEFPRWLVDRGCLAIRGAEWIAHLAARKAEELPPADKGKPVGLDVLRARAVQSRALVTRVEFGKGDRAISYESSERVSILNDTDLTKLAADVKGMSVERATIALIGGGTANLEFSAATALGPTSSSLPVGTLCRATLPLLTKVADEELASIAELLTESADGTLFEDDPEGATDA